MHENCFLMCFFEGEDVKVQLSLKFERCEHSDDTSIVVEIKKVWSVNCPGDQVEKVPPLVGG